jgi:predicted ArsR family transcriptional regulator
MPNENNPGTKFFRARFERFQTLSKEIGKEKALEKIFEGYPERHKKNMGRFIDDDTLVNGFRKAISEFEKNGWEMEAVDISNNGMDAVIEIQKFCPALQLCEEFGFDKPCFLVCDLDGKASDIVFPDMKSKVLCRQADGDCVCAFKYERKAQ